MFSCLSGDKHAEINKKKKESTPTHQISSKSQEAEKNKSDDKMFFSQVKRDRHAPSGWDVRGPKDGIIETQKGSVKKGGVIESTGIT